MNCLYITFFSTQSPAFSKHLLSLGTTFSIPESQKSSASPLNHVMTSCTSSSSKFSQRDISLGEETSRNHNVTINSNNLFVNFRWTFTFCVEGSYDGTHLAFGGDFGSALPFQTRLTQTKPVLPPSNKHDSQIKDEGRRQCCHN